ncbi:MAG TPA: ATP-dependent zinc metalloprotease FtsH, partial [Kofleriaceae bacterium]|nr:ATP-dependent zinc metalloprotease FtsH [Kofleriaceae bacterium]
MPFYLNWRWMLGFWAVTIAVQLALSWYGGRERTAYSDVMAQVDAGNVTEMSVGSDLIEGRYREPVDGKETFATVRVDDPKLVETARAHGVKISGRESGPGWTSLLGWMIPAGIVLLVIWIIRRMASAGGGLLSVGRSKARLYMENEVPVRFDDVAGADEAKQELAEVIEFLTHPERFKRLGGALPRGILLVGPPGTGKTLLARAVAGEAKVPFFSISGSAFVEMFVGVGAARVRDLFAEARAKGPCIIFIDELDALGKARSAGGMAHEEREQTLNQLLVELDGFDPQTGLVLMAATNRPEILDPALLRPGRFDRHIVVDRPDREGRRAILVVHARKVVLAEDANLDELAAMTAGLAGADLANIVNEAALLAARRGAEAVHGDDLLAAFERVVAGMEKKNRVLTAAEKRRVAYHEIGHALTNMLMPGADLDHVRKISIIPRGVAALGYTLQLPHEDRFLMTEGELERKIAVLLGGRVAELVVFGDASTGAQDDIQKATDIARQMVESYGMSTLIGTVAVGRRPNLLGLPAELEHAPAASPSTLREVDEEVRRLLARQLDQVRA